MFKFWSFRGRIVLVSTAAGDFKGRLRVGYRNLVLYEPALIVNEHEIPAEGFVVIPSRNAVYLQVV